MTTRLARSLSATSTRRGSARGRTPLSRGAQTWVVGAALLTESYDAEDVEGFDYSFTTPGLLSQVTLDAGSRLALTASRAGRLAQ